MNTHDDGFRALRRRVTRDEALRTFGAGGIGPMRFVSRLARGRIDAVADVYVPYHLFRVEISDRGRRQTSYFAIDAVAGALDLYFFGRGSPELDLVDVHTRNRVAVTLDAAAAWPLVAAKVERVLFQNGFFRLRDPQVTGCRELVDLHVPYWLAFYRKGPTLRLDVLDAVRRRIEGAKARALFEQWLQA